MDNGIMFGVYESGPWLAFKFSNDPFPGWIGGGTELFNMMVNNRINNIANASHF